LNIYNTGPEWTSGEQQNNVFLTADWSVSIDAHFIICCGIYTATTKWMTVTHQTNTVLRDVSKITLHYINT